jgi:alginate O-acetyltransferase complex protein AlgI
MVFASVEFLFVYLPLFLLAYALLPYKNLSYVLFSLAFYFAGEGYYALVIVGSVVANYAAGLAICTQSHAPLRRLTLAVGVSFNLSLLLFFKYASFLWTEVLRLPPNEELQALHLPLGISFFSFHAVSYLLDIYRGDARAERSFVNLTLYMFMFPQLIAGPILRFHSVAEQLRCRSVSARNVHFGWLLFCVGLGQKVLIADALARLVDETFMPDRDLSCAAAWLSAAAYAFQILFDFGGYSNMAIGLGYMTGFSLPKNFEQPYSAQSITEFWRRWHISLSRWFRDYLYIPLGGNRHGPVRTYLNLVAIFLICGLWHGAAWTFVVWGAYHGVWLVIERLGWARVLEALPYGLRHAYTLVVVVVGWVFFRADTLDHAIRVLSSMFTPSRFFDSADAWLFTRSQALAFAVAALLCLPRVSGRLRHIVWLVRSGALPSYTPSAVYWRGAVIGLVVFLLASANIIAGSYSSFIYFRF